MTYFRACQVFFIVVIGAICLPVSPSHAQASDQKGSKPSRLDRFFGIKRDPTGGWLFAGYKNEGQDGIYFAISKDGYHWKLVNDGRPMLKPSQRGE